MGKSSLLEGFSFSTAFCPSMLGFRPLAAKQTKREPKHRICIGVNGHWGNSLGRALLAGSGTENAALLALVLHRAAFTQRSFTQRSFTRRIFYTEKLVHSEDFTHRVFYREKVLHRKGFTHRSFYTKKFLHEKTFTRKLLQRNFYTELDTEKLAQRSLLHRAALHTEAFTQKTSTQRNLYTKKLYAQTSLHTIAFTHRSICTEKSLPIFHQVSFLFIFHYHSPSVIFTSSFSCSFGQLPPSFIFYFARCFVRPRFVLASPSKREPRNK